MTADNILEKFAVLWRISLTYAFMPALVGCSSLKFVPGHREVLSSVKVKSDNRAIDPSSFRGYVRQEANARWFNLVKVPLGIYCLSGKDSTKALNRFFRRMGEAPVLYDSTLMNTSREALVGAMVNKGYFQAHTDVEVRHKRKGRVKLRYMIHAGRLYHIRTFNYKCDDARIDSIIRYNESDSHLKINMPCDASLLEQERDRIVALLHREGYYNVLKNFISFELDSIKGPDELDLTLYFEGKAVSKDTTDIYTRYHIGNVLIDINREKENNVQCDSLTFRKVAMRFFGHRQFRPNVIYSQLKLLPGDLYNEDFIQSGYRNFSNLQALRYSIIRMEKADSGKLNCHVTLQADKVNNVSAELEGTNTSGDLGVASSLSYSNRNLFRGSEVWTTKLRAAFEAITGLEGYNDQNYFEIAAETHLSFPRIILPFQKKDHRIRQNGSSELSFMYNMQDRPEFHRRVLTGAWSYRWLNDHNRIQQKVDVFSINYVFMPWISNTFRKDYLDNVNSKSSIVRYSYENLFIVNSAYNFILNSAGAAGSGSIFRKNAYQVKFNVESAGNLLYILAGVAHAKKDGNGDYNLFNVSFAQYVKFDLDYVRSFLINRNNSFAVHGALGLAVPYGNASIIPFEKRYFAGGPNSIRGWSVRRLGPGRYGGADGKVDFINQSGNLKLLLSAELRSYLFWKLHGALFVDAGNVWNTRNYDAQPGGQFCFDKFYKQIAASYGWGVRMNFDYFILRFDWGMRAVDPTHEGGRDHYPVLHPRIGRDLTFHFAVGLPF